MNINPGNNMKETATTYRTRAALCDIVTRALKDERERIATITDPFDRRIAEVELDLKRDAMLARAQPVRHATKDDQ